MICHYIFFEFKRISIRASKILYIMNIKIRDYKDESIKIRAKEFKELILGIGTGEQCLDTSL